MKNNIGNIKQCRTLIKRGHVIVDDMIEYDDKRIINGHEVISVDNHIINSSPFVYYMLNKPKGYICANHDKTYKCITDLIDNKDCFCIGRLDLNTTGFVFITNDKSLSKTLSHPSFNKVKTYYVTLKNAITEQYIEIFKNGVIIDQGYQCKSSHLEIIDDYHCYVYISEGRYHQIKKMFLSCDNEVIELCRTSFCGIDLDKNLKEGQYRSLTKDELRILFDK